LILLETELILVLSVIVNVLPGTRV
jgi:hypothetical protein